MLRFTPFRDYFFEMNFLSLEAACSSCSQSFCSVLAGQKCGWYQAQDWILNELSGSGDYEHIGAIEFCMLKSVFTA